MVLEGEEEEEEEEEEGAISRRTRSVPIAFLASVSSHSVSSTVVPSVNQKK